jgi:hypothetical protein
MTGLEFGIDCGGLSPKNTLKSITRRGFGASILSGFAGAAVSRLIDTPSVAAAGTDFTIAIIPDPQFLAESCPDNSGAYYAALMNWIVDRKNLVLTSSGPHFGANIKAVVGVGDCVNSTGANQYLNAQTAWSILDNNGIAFITPPGNHDYSGEPSSRSNLGEQFATGYFSASNRASVYGSGISLGMGDIAYWAGSYDTTGANTAVKLVISGVKLLILALDLFPGNEVWSWAHDVMLAHSECECYIATHAWLTTNGTQFRRTDSYGPDAYSMAAAPYSNSASEAWSTLQVNTWPNLFGIFSGHDIMGSQNSDPSEMSSPAWFWKQVPAKSESSRGQTVHQLFVNAQQLDSACSGSVSEASGAGQVASVFLLSRRPSLGLLEGRMISTQTGDWFQSKSASFPNGTSWSASETLLFSIPFKGLHKKMKSDADTEALSPK